MYSLLLNNTKRKFHVVLKDYVEGLGDVTRCTHVGIEMLITTYTLVDLHVQWYLCFVRVDPPLHGLHWTYNYCMHLHLNCTYQL